MDSPSSSPDWTTELREFVEDLQEREYRKLAEELGLGADPQKAFAQLTRATMPLEHVSPEKLKRALGDQNSFTQEEWESFEAKVEGTHHRYFGARPPTRYEDPNRYASLAMYFDELWSWLAVEQGSRPFIATMPSGDVNARVVVEPASQATVIFFEQGLFRFFYDLSLVMGWALPVLPVRQSVDDSAIATGVVPSAPPAQASEYLLAVLHAYMVAGSTGEDAPSVPRNDSNIFIMMALLGGMERFVLAHELMHIALAHLESPPAAGDVLWRQEYDADEGALFFLARLAQATRGSWAVSAWATDVALTMLQFLYFGLGMVQFGTDKLRWISNSYPDPLNRRDAIRTAVASLAPELPAAGVDAFHRLVAISDAALWEMWRTAMPVLLEWHARGIRPSPLWKGVLTHHIAPETMRRFFLGEGDAKRT